ncbi:MAG: DUF1302 family protein [Syntrophorhabdales bacterium]
MRRMFLASVIASVLIALLAIGQGIAAEYDVGGRPFTIMGYITQGAAFNITGKNRLDAPQDLESALTNVFLETAYKPRDDLKFYGSGMFTADWAYDIKSNNNDWVSKGFASSRSNLYMDNKDWQLVKEAHVTWTPPNWNIRLGKQIVSWGEMDGFRLIDQINPLDGRRGFADVEFETTIIPLWMAKAEYYVPVKPSWIQDLGVEMVFNPNAEFVGNQFIKPGNNAGGIWAPDINSGLPSPPFPPGAVANVGSANFDFQRPTAFNSSGYEYGLRIKSVIHDSIITLNGFYGLDQMPVAKVTGMDPLTTAANGNLLLHPDFTGKYPLMRFVGGTFSRDITPLKASFLGGVAPVLRFETFYEFGATEWTSTNDWVHRDEFRYAAGMDWKVKIPVLNPRAYFTISPQFTDRRIMNYPDRTDFTLQTPGGPLYENNYLTSLMITTSYLHNKLVPSFFWMRDLTNRSNFFRYQVVYDYSNKWHFSLGVMTFSGSIQGQGFEPFHDKDEVYFKISYKFG